MVYLRLFKQQTIDIHTESINKVKELIFKYYNVDVTNYEILKNEYGKPYFKDLDIYFNISHTNNLMLIGISDSCIGVDIEKIKDFNDSVLNKMVDNDYYKYIKSLNYNNQKEIFFELWTKKESYSKYIGKSIVTELKNNDFSNTYSFKYIYDNDIYYISYTGENNYNFKGE